MNETPIQELTARERLIRYLRNNYTSLKNLVISVNNLLNAVENKAPDVDLDLLKACIASGDTKLLFIILQQIATTKIPHTKKVMQNGSLTFHEDREDGKEDWVEFTARNLSIADKNRIYQALLQSRCRSETFESTIPLINCSIRSTSTISNLQTQLPLLLGDADNTFNALAASVDSTYKPQLVSVHQKTYEM